MCFHTEQEPETRTMLSLKEEEGGRGFKYENIIRLLWLPVDD